ncbi:MAG TPA: lytic transglycosylase domain-containing protein [Polyangiaceae bacterium]|nr:lytic transglycosylase domain-containing protein [Polyangiaceae bacterium]
MRFPIGCAAAAAAIGFLTSFSGCMTRAQRGAPALPSTPSTAVVSSARVAPEPIEGFDPGTVTLTLDAPALGEVRAFVVQLDYVSAARVLENALVLAPPTDVVDALRWRYQLGRLRALAGDHAGAARAFDEVTQAGGPLTPYSQLGAGQALIRIGHVDEGLARARAVPEDCAVYPLSRLLVAEGLELKRDFEGAIEIWSEYLAESRHPARWIEVALHMADAMLQGAPDAGRAEKAALLVRRIIVEAPTSNGGVNRALDMERRALALVPESSRTRPLVARGKNGAMLASDYARALSFPDQLARANAFVETQNYADAEKALDALGAVLGPKGAASEVGCRMNVALGAVLAKEKDRARAADTYGTAIARCEPYPEVLVEALYFGGKASATANRCDEALERFARVEHEFHEHRYADDARLRGAECALELGDDNRYAAMLASMPIDYPEGDMVTEALFRLALRKMVRRDWSPALVLLESARNFKIKEGPSSSAGRIPYYLARVLAGGGDSAASKQAYAQVIRDYPLSYYMLHAYARFSEIDERAARAVLDEVLAREPAGRFVIDDDELFHTAGFARATELLRQGENDFARRELSKLGLLKEGANGRALWAATALYARAGLPQLSHALPRFRVFDWLAHYPAGRWREAWEMAFPRAFSEVVEREATRNGIPSSLAYAVMREESAFDPEAVSPSRAFGLMQLIVPTARKVAKDVGIAFDDTLLSRPETNVALGCRFLADLRAKFPVNPSLAISAYNAGPGAPVRWIASRESDDFDLWVEQIPYEETKKYTKRVLASYAAYAFLYERDRLDTALKLPRIVAR